MMSLRNDLLHCCTTMADLPTGLFTLTAPTGTGKTLSLLSFALAHAKRHGLRRIVVVLPYLSIIEQTADEYKAIFRNAFPDSYILEHHSLANADESSNEHDPYSCRRLQTENWDAPIVITTSVQFFESLFSNRPGRCRKLHRLAKSVILFDEAQTLPNELAAETLATLAHLSQEFDTSIVFSTATQPAFGELDSVVRKLAPEGWVPVEIVPQELNIFSRSRRTRVIWREGEACTT